MNKLSSMVLGGTFALLLTATGCGGTCSTFCDYFSQDCGAESVTDGQCNWDDPDDIATRCSESCDKAMEQLSDKEREEVDACIDCMDESLAGECTDYRDYYDALADDCDSKCNDDGVGEFFLDNDGFYDNMNLDNGDVDC